MICIAKISKIDYEAGRADVTIEDREGIVITDVPFLDAIYEMPAVKDAVYVDFEEKGGRIKRGVILGKFYTSDNPPTQFGKGIFFKEFTDGAYIKYDPDSKTLELAVDKIKIKEIEVNGAANVKGNMTLTGSIAASGNVTGSGISLNSHTHTGVHGETSGPH